MAGATEALRAQVSAELPWRAERSVAGELRLEPDCLVLAPRAGGDRITIPLGTIAKATFETTFGVLPQLHVLHVVRGKEFRSRFEFSADDQPETADDGPGLADRMSPGVARDAAQALQGGLRALGGGLNFGMRTAKQAVDGIARGDEYRTWPAAILEAQKARADKMAARAQGEEAPSARPLVPAATRVPEAGSDVVFSWFREVLLPMLDACAARARELGVRGVPVIQPLYPLASPVCRIVVIGEFSRGKSTLINALFGIHGEIALPTGMTPTTAVACAIRVPHVGEEDGATITYRTKRPALHLSLDEFRRSVRVLEGAPEGNDARDLHLHEARRVEVRVTGAYLPAGVEIEDTPGLNEQQGRSAGALAALGRADLVLFVLAADQLLGDLEREVIRDQLVAGFHRNVLFLVNFWDSIDEEAQRANLRTRALTLLEPVKSPFAGWEGGANQSGERRADLYYISALTAARAQRQRQPAPEESGIPRLRATLRSLLGPESQSLLLRARAGRALRFATLARRAISDAGAAEALGNAAPLSSERTIDEAVVGAVRALESMAPAVEAAVKRALSDHTSEAVQVMARLRQKFGERQREQSVVDLAQRRQTAASLGALSAGVAAAAQYAVDGAAAEARAAFLARHCEPPVLDARFEPLAFGLPAETSPGELAALIAGVDGMLYADGEEKARRIAAKLSMEARSHAARTGGQPAGAAKPPPAVNQRRLQAIRLLEEDMLRIEQLLRALL